MYSLSWFILCVLIILGGMAYVGFISYHKRRKGKEQFDVRKGDETGYRGPREQPSSYF